jgi:hypothetical protein
MTNDDELGYPEEDFKSIPKDTKIFIIFDPQDMDSYAARNKTVDQLELAGFTNIHNHSVAYYGKILDGSYDINLQIEQADRKFIEASHRLPLMMYNRDPHLDHSDARAIRKSLLEHYTHTLLLRKIRALKKQVIVLQAGVIFRDLYTPTSHGVHRNFINRELLNLSFEPLVTLTGNEYSNQDYTAGYWVSPKAAKQLVGHLTNNNGMITKTLDSTLHSFYYHEVIRNRQKGGEDQLFDEIPSRYTMFVREN